MRRALWIGLVLLVVGSALPVEAASAEFQGNCNNQMIGGQLVTDCVFDPTRTPSGSTPTSCSPSSVVTYFWDYGDSTPAFFTSSNYFVTNRYYGQGDW